MAEAIEAIELTIGWDDLGEAEGFRRNTVGLGGLNNLMAQAQTGEPVKVNAFLYAFLCPAKNLDLFLTENTAVISAEITEISGKMDALSDFEREARTLPDEALVSRYLALRNVVGRASARDECRTLATLLFSGPSNAQQIADDLGISENLAERMFRALGSVLHQQDDGQFTVCSDTDSLAVVLYLLRSTIGVDPTAVLRRRVAAHAAKGG